jgi:DNA-binding transcriptional MerR regulator
MFTEDHLDQMRMARTVFGDPWPGRYLRRSSVALVRQAAAGDLGGALEGAYDHLALVQTERAQAEAAAEFLERWAQGAVADASAEPLRIGQAADVLAVTTDTLRSWERNGLIQVPRDPGNGYRLYGAAEIGRLRVVRMLRRAGYSTMAILRMLLRFDQGQTGDLRQVLDTPRPDEDAIYAADRWLSTLATHEERARDVITQLEAMMCKRQN